MSTPTYVSGILFTNAHKLVRGRIYELLEKYDLNPSTWSILGITLAAEEGIRLASVAESMHVQPPLITMQADQLIAQGLIRRIPHHSDRRAKLLVITPEGKKLAATIEVQLNKSISDLLTGVSTTEIAAFQKTLETIIKNSDLL